MAKQSLDIVYNAFIKAPPARVFRALTDPKDLVRWFVSKAEIDLRKGGNFTFVMDGTTEEHKILKVVKNKLISYTWPTSHGPTARGVGSVVTFSLRPKSGGTVVTLRHQGFKRGRMYTSYSAGWIVFMINLKSWVERKWDLRADQPKDIETCIF